MSRRTERKEQYIIIMRCRMASKTATTTTTMTSTIELKQRMTNNNVQRNTYGTHGTNKARQTQTKPSTTEIYNESSANINFVFPSLKRHFIYSLRRVISSYRFVTKTILYIVLRAVLCLIRSAFCVMRRIVPLAFGSNAIRIRNKTKCG